MKELSYSEMLKLKCLTSNSYYQVRKQTVVREEIVQSFKEKESITSLYLNSDSGYVTSFLVHCVKDYRD